MTVITGTARQKACWKLFSPPPSIPPGVEEVLDLRCPQPDWLHGEDGQIHPYPGQLLARLRLAGLQPSFVQPDNLIELPCDDCKYHLKKKGRKVRRVLHRYDLAGECIATLVQEDERDLAVPRG